MQKIVVTVDGQPIRITHEIREVVTLAQFAETYSFEVYPAGERSKHRIFGDYVAAACFAGHAAKLQPATVWCIRDCNNGNMQLIFEGITFVPTGESQ